eukprot:TRINITY_DN20818_c0_g1_i1.p1 TRINITY_DN20818_c0_g1~~TRINITY_DN20818_c0_g1_i1.p1  ORF type:complete len:139 (+),score=51.21 TRINITY_DN20818_c0_g1_i1:202-618(+)
MPDSRGNEVFMQKSGSGRPMKMGASDKMAKGGMKGRMEDAQSHRAAIGNYEQDKFEKDKVAELLLAGGQPEPQLPALHSSLDASSQDAREERGQEPRQVGGGGSGHASAAPFETEATQVEVSGQQDDTHAAGAADLEG